MGIERPNRGLRVSDSVLTIDTDTHIHFFRYRDTESVYWYEKLQHSNKS